MKIRFGKNGLLILVSALIVLFGNFSAAIAEKGDNSVDWASFKLTNQQLKSIKVLDVKWQKTSGAITAQILRDQQKLRKLLKNPNSKDSDLRILQKQIIAKQDRLKFEALEMFLDKRRVLTPQQRKKLHKMLSQ